MGYYLHPSDPLETVGACHFRFGEKRGLAEEQSALLASPWLDVLIPGLPVERLGSRDELKPIYASYLFI